MAYYTLFSYPESAQFWIYFNLERVSTEQILSINVYLVFLKS